MCLCRAVRAEGMVSATKRPSGDRRLDAAAVRQLPPLTGELKCTAELVQAAREYDWVESSSTRRLGGWAAER